MINKEAKLNKAKLLTKDAVDAISQFEKILQFTLKRRNTFNWETLKDNSTFDKLKPKSPKLIDIPEIPIESSLQNQPDLDSIETLILAPKDKTTFNKLKPVEPNLREVLLPPIESDLKYQPNITLLDKLISTRKVSKIKNIEEIFKKDFDLWNKQKEEILKENLASEELYQKQLVLWREEIQKHLVLRREEIQRELVLRREKIIKKNKDLEEEYKKQLELWYTSKRLFHEKQQTINKPIDAKKVKYLNNDQETIIDYCTSVLSNSEYPDSIPKNFKLDYNPETKILILEYSLPSINKMPKIKDVKYIQSRNIFVNRNLSESAINKLYDNVIYQIALRSIHELYKADSSKIIKAIVFNGWVSSINKATGKKVNACIISVMANRSEFLSLKLSSVDPKLCFKNLKGIGSSQLFSLTPIAPVLTISREDKRFTSSYAVADELDESNNLAAMDWEDFEHLIRELFEKEFAQYGGEVKVTQASRDGGVDAVAFDPDPIRGGKIVIQAKRYTNTVGVSAVRDLFGTVMNEGATKGILVTTADYGPDAYEFAKGKPLTLLSGSNLLHLLDKHGHKANIDLKAAKIILAEREKSN